MEFESLKQCSPGRTRTYDQLINSQLLYRLSYRGVSQAESGKLAWLSTLSGSGGCPGFQIFRTVVRSTPGPVAATQSGVGACLLSGILRIPDREPPWPAL